MSEENKISPASFVSAKLIVSGNAELAKAHREIVDNPAFQMSAIYTLSEMARMNISADEMRGANAFLETFLSLAEKPVENRPAFPHKHLHP